MWSTWLNQSTLPALEQSVAFAQKRHHLLAGNIANIDVPDYRTRDLSVEDFQQALQESIQANEASNSGLSSTIASPGDRYQISPAEKVRDVANQVLYLDGNDISLEQQVTQIAKNQLMHDTAISLMRSQFKLLNAAITESANV